MYFRIDLDDHLGEHLAIFADANPDGTIFQQFAIALEGELMDLEHCRISTVFGVNGRPVEHIDPKMGWRQIGGDEWETGVRLKERIVLRDHEIQRTQHPPCAMCGGKGKLASNGSLCPKCAGSGQL